MENISEGVSRVLVPDNFRKGIALNPNSNWAMYCSPPLYTRDCARLDINGDTITPGAEMDTEAKTDRDGEQPSLPHRSY